MSVPSNTAPAPGVTAASVPPEAGIIVSDRGIDRWGKLIGIASALVALIAVPTVSYVSGQNESKQEMRAKQIEADTLMRERDLQNKQTREFVDQLRIDYGTLNQKVSAVKEGQDRLSGQLDRVLERLPPRDAR